MKKQQGRPLNILELQDAYLELMVLMVSMGMMIYLIEVEKQMRNMSILPRMGPQQVVGGHDEFSQVVRTSVPHCSVLTVNHYV